MTGPQDEPLVEPIAVVGLACRLPGAQDVTQFWSNLVGGVESVRFYTREEQAALGVPDYLLDDPNFVRAAAITDDYGALDAAFFGMSPREAELRDPQQRLFLELSATALEDAGYDPARYDGDIGVYGAIGSDEYQWVYIRRDRKTHASAGNLAVYVGNHPDYLSTFVSYKLDLRGPSLTLHTACSSSLVAVHVACEALRGGECDMALTGGASFEMPPEWGYLYHQDGIYAPDGHCRAFDASAKGTIWGGGGGVAVLKRLSDAIADGDHIRAVIRGNAINNDGSTKAGFSAPSLEGQAVAVSNALSVAGVEPRTVTYVEAHGTGTSVGDPIEVGALASVFSRGTDDAGWCAIGSVKSNIGHLGPAAGIAGLTKTVLAVEHGLIPPTLNYERPNPRIPFGENPFRVAAELAEWKSNGVPRRAGVSSFGIGGTNAHVVVEEAPPLPPVPREHRSRHLLRLSARTPTALAAMVSRLAARLEEADLDLADVAQTLRTGRREMKHRAVVVAGDRADAVRALGDSRRLIRGVAGSPRVAWLFSGQGAQYAGMGAELYRTEAVFRDTVDECAELLRPELGLDLRELIFGDESANERLRRTELTQPALFTVEYALAMLWRSWGVEPGAMIGHSIGEYVAATVAGVFDLPGALRLVAARGRLMQSMPPGAMLAVRLDEQEVRPGLPEGLSIATVNGPGACVVAGPVALVEEYAARLAADDIGHTALRTSHAFHSPMMDPILADFHQVVASIDRQAPALPFLSNVTGTWITAAEATDPAYWARHLREPVRFADCVATLAAEGEWHVVECGPGRQLAGLIRSQLPMGAPAPLPSLPGPTETATDLQVIYTAAGTLWAAGAVVDALGEPGRRVPLPTYPYERTHHWVPVAADPELIYPKSPQTGALPVEQWFALPSWRQAPLAAARRTPDLTGRRWLAFAGPAAEPLLAALEAAGAEVIRAVEGKEYGRAADGSFTLRPGSREDCELLLAETGTPARILHAWALDGQGGEPILDAQDRGFFSLLALFQALAQSPREQDAAVHLDVLTEGTQGVLGHDVRRPEHATVTGIASVLPLEAPWLSVRHLDVESASGDLEATLAELATDPAEPDGGIPSPVVLRAGRRWTRGYEPVELPEPADPMAGLREGGVYVVTGGLGGIGLTLAEDLATRTRGALVLLGRSGLNGSRGARAAEAIARMEQAGAQVLVLAADVTDATALREVRDTVLARFGRIDGLVHAAGLPGGGMAEVKDREAALAVMAPKLLGAQALREVFGELDFVLLCSSVTAVAGGFGQVDYCGANAFLDAYAATWPGRVISANWGAWLEVGMAAEVEAPKSFRALQRGDQLSPLDHPILTELHEPADGRLPWCGGRISPATHWVLAEHRLAGVPVMPGTGYLECARAAFAAVVPSPSAEHVVVLRDVAFVAPLPVAEDASADLRVLFTATAEGADFEVISGGSQTHVKGSAAWNLPEPAPLADLAGIQERCSFGVREENLFASASGLVTFGPRWRSLRSVAHGVNEELARLEACPETAAELDRFGLHPALLDEATAFVSAAGEHSYLPLGYGKLTVHAPMPARVWSHAVHRDTGGEVIAVDLTLYDDTGRRIVEIAEFVLRRVDAGAMSQRVEEGARESADVPEVAEESAAAGVALDREGARLGILPVLGADAFRRLLAFAVGPQVVVNATALADFVAGVRTLTKETIEDGLRPVGTGTDGGDEHGDTGYIAPQGEVETTLAALWCEVLGTRRVSADEDFFELGGNSLVAVQLIALIRRKLGVRLPMRSLFEVATIRGMGALVTEAREQGQSAPARITPRPRA
ncbi:SDR family NAD(P)-dependent oxidoreductase [Nonomuraea sp. NPDC050310]|uniref:type I polyketide synthase n=1 Tax=Nonomuraea sp. NPDC050310 TaxID=3154935 RepID=UPI0033EEB24B